MCASQQALWATAITGLPLSEEHLYTGLNFAQTSRTCCKLVCQAQSSTALTKALIEIVGAHSLSESDNCNMSSATIVLQRQQHTRSSLQELPWYAGTSMVQTLAVMGR